MAITKRDLIRVMIITKDHRIEGDMHVLEGSRLTDSLNSRSKEFYPVTDAKVFTLTDDRLLASPPFLAVSREAISAIFPTDEG